MKKRSVRTAQARRPSATIRRATLLPIESRITILRRQRVILDTALAEIYGVPVKRLNQQVSRNQERFPSDFMFQLKPGEFKILKLQIATARKAHGGRRSLPFAFTEHGAVMAATVLNSKQAVTVSVFVVRVFIRLREMLSASKELAGRLEELEKHLKAHDGTIEDIIGVIKKLMTPPPKIRRKIGFVTPTTKAG